MAQYYLQRGNTLNKSIELFDIDKKKKMFTRVYNQLNK